MPHIYVALDIETTGLDPQRDAIIEIGAVKFRGQEVLDTWSSLVNPQRPLPYNIQRLTGISPEEADSAPPLFSLLGPLSRFVGHHPLVGHNIAFDLAFLGKHGLFLTHQALDTFELASSLVLYVPSYSLAALAQTLGVSQEEEHRALADALTTKEVFGGLWERALRLDLKTIQEINRLALGSDWPLRHFFLDLEREKAATFGTSLREQLVARRGQEALLSPLFSRRVELKRLKPTSNPKPLDVEALSATLEEGGPLKEYLPHYEYRPQQVEMLKAVARAFNEGEHRLIEAGAGIGKSLAYLLPAVHFAVENGRHVVVSTNTINLQDQLFKKDIPDLQQILPFEAALLKGRSNYLCLRKFSYLKRREGLTRPEIGVLAKILVWLPTTMTGDRVELSLLEGEEQVWARVSAEEPCEPEKCPFLRECYFYLARRRAEGAHIIVVNHALLLSDMMTENRALPEYRHLIIDEAHHLEDRATEQLSAEVNQRWIYALLERIDSRGKAYGLLNRLSTYLKERSAASTLRREVEGYIEVVRQQAVNTRETLRTFLEALSLFLAHHRRGNERYDQRIRLTSALRAQPDWVQVEMAWEPLSQGLARLAEGLKVVHRGLLGLGEEYEDLLFELRERESEVHTLRQEMEAIIAQPQPGRIYWATIAAGEKYISLHDAPLHVGDILRESLFAPLETLLLTSATLRTGDDFGYLRERLGLEDAEELTLGSPFDYETSTLIFIPTDIPEPNTPGYLKAANETLLHLCLAVGGKTLGLFTSKAHLLEAHKALARPLEGRGIQVYGQGIDGSRHHILENFRHQPQSVLLGTRSFWEGIDVMGEALSCLVIARLPFPVPDDPIIAARSEAYEDPFGQYAVPQTVLRFRQGFGRLIRSKTDRGVVVVLDKRVLTKYYGSVFIDSLPQCTIQKGSAEELPKVAAEWIERA
ncbi:MAG: helicase C-terminal domain-containing protein [Anaerolineae bacterium]